MESGRQHMLNKLNGVQAIKEKTVLKFDELKIGHNYIIEMVKIVSTRYGKKLLVETEDNTIFLPDRFNVLDEVEIQNLNLMCKETLVMVKPDKYNLKFV